MSTFSSSASESQQSETPEQFADRIWLESYEQARSNLERELYGGYLLSVPSALVGQGTKVGRRGFRIGRTLVQGALFLAALGLALAVLLAVGNVLLLLVTVIPWDIIALVALAVLVTIGVVVASRRI